MVKSENGFEKKEVVMTIRIPNLTAQIINDAVEEKAARNRTEVIKLAIQDFAWRYNIGNHLITERKEETK